jgi:hypothetical protein
MTIGGGPGADQLRNRYDAAMQLTLRILTYRNQPVPPAPPCAVFGAEGGSIGRSPRQPAGARRSEQVHFARPCARAAAATAPSCSTDVGSNASVVNDRPLGKGTRGALAHGDRVLIGDYLLQAAWRRRCPRPGPDHAGAGARQQRPALPLFEPPPPQAPRCRRSRRCGQPPAPLPSARSAPPDARSAGRRQHPRRRVRAAARRPIRSA